MEQLAHVREKQPGSLRVVFPTGSLDTAGLELGL